MLREVIGIEGGGGGRGGGGDDTHVTEVSRSYYYGRGFCHASLLLVT